MTCQLTTDVGSYFRYRVEFCADEPTGVARQYVQPEWQGLSRGGRLNKAVPESPQRLLGSAESDRPTQIAKPSPDNIFDAQAGLAAKETVIHTIVVGFAIENRLVGKQPAGCREVQTVPHLQEMGAGKQIQIQSPI